MYTIAMKMHNHMHKMQDQIPNWTPEQHRDLQKLIMKTGQDISKTLPELLVKDPALIDVFDPPTGRVEH